MEPSELTFQNIANKHELVTCAGEVRFIYNTRVGPIWKLQQRFEIVSCESGIVTACRQEWRDVPHVVANSVSDDR